jgi:hypothetical protein
MGRRGFRFLGHFNSLNQTPPANRHVARLRRRPPERVEAHHCRRPKTCTLADCGDAAVSHKLGGRPFGRVVRAALRSTSPWMFDRGSTVPIEVDALPLISSKVLPRAARSTSIVRRRPGFDRPTADNGPMDHVRARLGRPGQNAAPGLNGSRAACRSG